MSVQSLFASLIAKKTRDEVLAEYLAVLKAVGFPTTSWYSTSVPLRLLTAMAGTHAKFTETLEAVTKGGYLELATGSWLTLLALSVYKITRYEATSTILHGSIADIASAGPFAITAGQLRFATASGKIFANDEAFNVTLDGVTDFTMTAAAAGSTYNVGAGEVVRLLTPLPGAGFAPHTEARTTGSAPPAAVVTGTATGSYDFAVVITTAGALGAAVFKWSDDGGSTWTTGVTLPGSGIWSPGGYGVTVTFAAGAYTTDHSYRWCSGATSYNPRTDCIYSTGTDTESDPLLRQRCEDKWATLAYGANAAWYRYYCRNTPTYGVSVTRVAVSTAEAGTGYITLTLAGPSGAVDSTTLAAVDDFIQAIKPECVTVFVVNATEVAITPVGAAYVYADYVATALGSIEDALDAYLGAWDLGGGTVYLSQIVDAIQYDSTEVKYAALTSPAANVPIAATEVPVRGSLAGLTINSV